MHVCSSCVALVFGCAHQAIPPDPHSTPCMHATPPCRAAVPAASAAAVSLPSYAVVGSAALLGGVTRMLLSSCVIVMETTGGVRRSAHFSVLHGCLFSPVQCQHDVACTLGCAWDCEAHHLFFIAAMQGPRAW